MFPRRPSGERHRGFMIDPLEPRKLNAAVAGSLDASKTFQTIDSFGATSIAWDHAPEDQSAAMYDAIVNDLGASGARGAVWPNFEVANDNADPNVFDWSKFDSKQLAHVMQFNQRMKERGVKTFFLSVWTPPYWMKTNRSLNGAGNLRPDMRAEYAEYLAAVVIASKRDFGIDLAAVSIQNEQFFPEGYESSLYDAAALRETLVAVQKKFAYEHLTTKVIANEDLTLADVTRWKWFNQPILDDAEVDRSKLIIGAHYPDPVSLTSAASQLTNTDIPLWYTEVSGKSGNFDGGVRTASDLSDILTHANASAYYYWTFDNATTNPPSNQLLSLMANGVPNGKFYALKHFYKYIRPGMQRVQTSVDEATGMRLSAFRDPTTGKLTIVFVNNSATDNAMTISLAGLGPQTAALRGFKSSQSAYWQSMGTFNVSGTSVSVTVPTQGIVTLTSMPDPAPIAGAGSPPLTIYNTQDAVLYNPMRFNAMLGNVTEVQRLISTGVSVNAADPLTGWTPLHAAAASVFPGAAATVDALLAAGANVNAKDIDGFTPLHAAAMNQMLVYTVDVQARAGIVAKLIAAGANANARDNSARTPLMWAALTPATYEIKSEIAGQPVTIATNTAVPMMLLSKGANATLRDAAGRSAYDYAVQEYKPEFMSLFAGAGLDTVAPITRFAKYSPDKNLVSIVITENVTATFDATDIVVINRQTNAAVTIGSLSESFSTGLTIAQAKFTGRLPDGHYRFTVPAGAFTDPNGLPSTVINVDFDVLAGDANNDGRVNFDDLILVAQNYNAVGRTRSQGDLNDDGKVNFDDLIVLAQHYNTVLPPLANLVTPKPARRPVANDLIL